MKLKIFLILTFFYHGVAMAKNPEEILAYIEWDFEAEVTKDYLQFLDEAKKIQQDIDKEIPLLSPYRLYIKFLRTNLHKEIGYKEIKIQYEYSTEDSSGEWVDHETILEISDDKNLTFGQLLYHLHHFTKKNLHNQDIMAIEGFELKEGSENDEVPIYHVFFGS